MKVFIMIISLVQISFGLLLLYAGAEGLVRASSSLALRLKISPLVIGLTIVAFGTSMPELVVSMKTALSHQGAISIGNVVGSNIFNIAIILGLSALIYPLKINIKLLRSDTPIMILAAILFVILFRDFQLTFLEGFILFFCIVLYTVINFYLAKRASVTDINQIKSEIVASKYFKNIYIEILTIVVSLLILVIGAKYLINGSVNFAKLLGISEAVIGLTIIAAGTSLPELATSVVASYRKQSDIAVGNIIGSNIFNILGILGISSLLSPINGTGINLIDVYVMIAVSILLFPLMLSKFEIKRWEGLILLGFYVVYIYYLVNS